MIAWLPHGTTDQQRQQNIRKEKNQALNI